MGEEDYRGNLSITDYDSKGASDKICSLITGAALFSVPIIAGGLAGDLIGEAKWPNSSETIFNTSTYVGAGVGTLASIVLTYISKNTKE